jgi:spore maturation protein CgeB
MHVGLIGTPGPDRFQDNIADALRQMGHRVTELGDALVARGGRVATRTADLVFTAMPGVERRYQHRAVRSALEHECDAVISTAGGLSPDAVSGLRDNGVPVALWFPDSVANMFRQRMLLAPYNALFFKDPLLVRRLRDTLNLPVWYLPEACNPHRHRPVGEPASRPTIVVVGSTYPSRLLLVRRLLDAGIPMTIYGAPTPRWAAHLLPPGLHRGRYLVGEDKARVFRGAAGVLNNLHPAEMHGVNCRLFEAAGSGAAVLCERRPVLDELFDTEREVVPFSTFDELLEQAKALIADPSLTRDVGDAASKRAHAEHTYELRLETILDRLA